jgi:hypothetical protein
MKGENEMEMNEKTGIIAVMDAWDKLIEKCGGAPSLSNPDNDVEEFLTTIWSESRAESGAPLDIQVAIDSHGGLHTSKGTPGIMPILEQRLLAGESVTIDCWIHTMPLVKAHFTEMTWQTIRAWGHALNSVIALGDNQYIAYRCETELCKHVFYGFYRGKSGRGE